MGLGKTASTLEAIRQLIYEEFAVNRVLVIAPKLVAQDTWIREARKWDDFHDLRVSVAVGTAKQRQAALATDADIYTINRENVTWLIEQQEKTWPYDMIVVDESSSFKNQASKRFKALKRVIPKTQRVVILTGTPAPNSYLELWPQLWLLDRGERLGSTIGRYRDRWFVPDKRNGHIVYSWRMKPGARQQIDTRISDICMSMKTEDWLKLPERIDNVIPVRLPDEAKDTYQTLQHEMILALENGDAVVGDTKAAVINKLLQMANGAVYTEQGAVEWFHDAKLEALEEIVEQSEEPVLVFYTYRHDLDRLQERFRDLHPRMLYSAEDIRDWNAGKIRMLLAHPASIGHGLNLQEGGHVIVWYGLTWSLELYEQANARLHRQGQTQAVIIHHLVAEGTADEQVMKALERKEMNQDALLEALKWGREHDIQRTV